MAIKNDDLLYVQRPSGVDAGGYKITAGDLLNGASGGSSVTVDETAPLNPAEGDLWWADSDVDEGGGRLYVWTGDEWVDTSLPGGGAGEFLSKTDDDTAAGEITFEGQTTHEDGVSVTGGTIANGTIAGSIDEAAGNYYTYFHGTSSNPCAQISRYSTSKGTYNGINIGTTSQSSTNTSGISLLSTVSATTPANQTNAINVYCPVKDVVFLDEVNSENVVFQVIAGTEAEATANSGLKPVKMRISRNGSIFAGNFAIADTTLNYKIDGIYGDAEFRQLDLRQYAKIIGANPTSASNLCIRLGDNTNNKNSVYCDSVSGKNRIWLNGGDGASYNIGCRTGGEQLDAIVLNAASITANGTPLSLFTPVDPGVTAVGITDAVTTVKSLLPHASGFDATQLQSVLPGAFSTNEVVTDADANTTETVTSYDQTKLIPLLTKALQEALTEIDNLKTRIETLEGGTN